jgi:adenylyltransferase/sulfurtransferase
MTESMWQRIHERRSCLAAQRFMPERRIATTASLASLVAALQVQEAVAQLHRGSVGPVLEAGDRVAVSVAPYSMSVLHGKVREDCLAHPDKSAASIELKVSPEAITLARLLQESGGQALELDWDVATELVCLSCGDEPCCIPAWALPGETLPCPVCRQMRRPEWQSRFARASELADRTLSELGVPPLAYLCLVTNKELSITVRLTGA